MTRARWPPDFRGAKRTGLGVDANNPSATKLDMGVGMHSLQEYVQYERPQRDQD